MYNPPLVACNPLASPLFPPPSLSLLTWLSCGNQTIQYQDIVELPFYEFLLASPEGERVGEGTHAHDRWPKTSTLGSRTSVANGRAPPAFGGEDSVQAAPVRVVEVQGRGDAQAPVEKERGKQFAFGNVSVAGWAPPRKANTLLGQGRLKL